MYNALYNGRAVKLYHVLHCDCVRTCTQFTHFGFVSKRLLNKSYISYDSKYYIMEKVCICSCLHQENTTHFQIWYISLWTHLWLQKNSTLYNYFPNLRECSVAIYMHHNWKILPSYHHKDHHTTTTTLHTPIHHSNITKNLQQFTNLSRLTHILHTMWNWYKESIANWIERISTTRFKVPGRYAILLLGGTYQRFLPSKTRTH